MGNEQHPQRVERQKLPTDTRGRTGLPANSLTLLQLGTLYGCEPPGSDEGRRRTVITTITFSSAVNVYKTALP